MFNAKYVLIKILHKEFINDIIISINAYKKGRAFL